MTATGFANRKRPRDRRRRIRRQQSRAAAVAARCGAIVVVDNLLSAERANVPGDHA